MGKPRVIKAVPAYSISDGVVTHCFPSEYDLEVAEFFFDKEADLLYAIAVDYPGLYKIPLYLREAVKVELKKLGFKTYRPENREGASYEVPPFAMLFYLGPRPNSSYYGTPSYLATSFKIQLNGFRKLK